MFFYFIYLIFLNEYFFKGINGMEKKWKYSGGSFFLGFLCGGVVLRVFIVMIDI